MSLLVVAVVVCVVGVAVWHWWRFSLLAASLQWRRTFAAWLHWATRLSLQAKMFACCHSQVQTVASAAVGVVGRVGAVGAVGFVC